MSCTCVARRRSSSCCLQLGPHVKRLLLPSEYWLCCCACWRKTFIWLPQTPCFRKEFIHLVGSGCALHWSAAMAVKQAELMTALYDYTGADQAQGLPLAAGGIVVVLERLDSGWCRGEFNNRQGWFPTTYIQPAQVGCSPPRLHHP